MAERKKRTVVQFLTERFASEWKLLSETEAYMSKIPEFYAYELQFKTWRQKLQNKSADSAEVAAVRSDIIALRRELRLRGYDLSLGLLRLTFDGFRNDDSMAHGFKRIVVCFCDPNVYYVTGSGNHIELAEELNSHLQRRGVLHDPEFHYLWYLRMQRDLILSGAATETEEDFVRLTARGNANPLKMLTALKNVS